jgi:hypothetical protein
MLNKNNQKIMNAFLDDWFKSIDMTKPHFWQRESTAIIIRRGLQGSGKWMQRAHRDDRKKYKKEIIKKLPELKLVPPPSNNDW